MKSSIQLPITSGMKILVSEGDKIDINTVLAEIKTSDQNKMIQLSKLLNIKADQIPKYLVKIIGDEVNEGEIIAQKKGLFSNYIIKSPLTGKIKEIDLKAGTMTLIDRESKEINKLYSPVSGRVAVIEKANLSISIDGEVFKGKDGSGQDCLGELVYLPGENLSALDINHEVSKKIVLCQGLYEEGIVKLDVLEAKGIILKKKLDDIPIPWIQISEEVFSKLTEYAGKTILLWPKIKQIVVIE
ncbi:hypothetical protein A2960_02615 [Candidatus Gottesmanbacteria bacterium RIFCSPLOWO2_01_FULL_39_12b]|uniref:Uncharacterized protein n=1 Tax=Candidatus Gottesmanbacteria bacterium RIFCSPLOWO2_01_FULL_39_12b TaxID=1798388 RepID=A0A1F6AQP2_9BACT|nr:MAG: hypothetical protein A2960_02615 [Candidatus Gottesmanbacteria bacterium RIFCSPLOWO2_01_FULL_39_12b]